MMKFKVFPVYRVTPGYVERNTVSEAAVAVAENVRRETNIPFSVMSITRREDGHIVKLRAEGHGIRMCKLAVVPV